jgi:cyclohexadienyl dehydratase
MKNRKILGRLVVILLLVLSIIGTIGYFDFASAASTLQEIQKRGVLRFGWGVWYPYVYRNAKTNQLTGITVDLAEEMAKALNVKLEWIEESWGTFAAGLQGNKFDIFNLVAITLPRGTVAGFSDPVTVHGISLATKKDSEPDAKSWKDMDKKGKKISVTFGSNTDLYLTRSIKDAEIVRLKTVPEAWSAMVLGKAHAYAGTIDSLLVMTKTTPGTVVLSGEFARSPVAFAVRQDDQIWLNWVNLFVREMKMTGTIRHLLEKHGLGASFVAE